MSPIQNIDTITNSPVFFDCQWDATRHDTFHAFQVAGINHGCVLSDILVVCRWLAVVCVTGSESRKTAEQRGRITLPRVRSCIICVVCRGSDFNAWPLSLCRRRQDLSVGCSPAYSLFSVTEPFYSCSIVNEGDDIARGNWHYVVANFGNR